MSNNPNRSFSLLSCTPEELDLTLSEMKKQERIEAAALKWTRSDIRKVEKIKLERFGTV